MSERDDKWCNIFKAAMNEAGYNVEWTGTIDADGTESWYMDDTTHEYDVACYNAVKLAGEATGKWYPDSLESWIDGDCDCPICSCRC